MSPRTLLAHSLTLLLPGIALAQQPVPIGPGLSNPANEQEAALAPPVPVTVLPGARDGDPDQRAKLASGAYTRTALERAARNPAIFRDAVGVLEDGDRIHGAGADYKVTFERDRAVFTPALPQAPHNVPVEFRVQSYGRGAPSTAVSPATIDLTGNTISYRRPEFVETWDVRADACKQSFRFDRLPEGGGDLVVSMQLATELTPRIDGPDAMSLLLDGIGGVTIKDVIGIDANGQRIQGSLQHEGSTLQLRLPAAAVDAAALPLILDPIVGTTITVIASTYNTFDPDVAFDEASNLFFVVYARQFSATDYDIHAQRVTTAGALSGGVVLIDNSSATIDTNGRVSTINSQNAFCVVWRRDNGTADDIYGRAVRAADAAMSPSTILVNSANNLGLPDIGGEATLTDNDGILVWLDITTGEINAKQVAVTANTAPTNPTISPFAAVVLIGDVSATWTNTLPAISESGGDTGNHCIVWQRQFTSSANTAVRAAIVSRNLTVLENFMTVASTAADNDSPDVDGNGRNWVVAWDREATSGNGDPGIIVRGIGWNPQGSAGNQGFFVTGDVVVEDDANDVERTPAVAWTGDGVLVAYVDNAVVGDDDIFANLLDLYTCTLCRTTDYTIEGSTDTGDSPAISSGRSGGENTVRCLITHRFNDVTTPPAGSNPDIRAIRFDADEGTVTTLGGGCGAGGVMGLSCAISPNAAFTLRLFGAAPAATGFLVLSPTTLNLSCGSCTLIPNPFTGFIASTGATDAMGSDTFALPIPAAVIGASLTAQWLVAGTNCLGGFDLSTAIRVTVQ
jgi:hypothetical protein